VSSVVDGPPCLLAGARFLAVHTSDDAAQHLLPVKAAFDCGLHKCVLLH
jgi:hypothetical protein